MFDEKLLNKTLINPPERLDALITLEAYEQLKSEEELEEYSNPLIEMIPGGKWLILFKGLLKGKKYDIHFDLKL